MKEMVNENKEGKIFLSLCQNLVVISKMCHHLLLITPVNQYANDVGHVTIIRILYVRYFNGTKIKKQNNVRDICETE
jgi:hypothetical protein